MAFDHPSEQGLSGLIRRRWRAMGLAFTGVVLVGASGLALAPRTYEAKAKVLVMRMDQRAGGMKVVKDALPALTTTTSPLFTQVELLRTEAVFADVISRLKLTDEAGAPLTPAALARRVSVRAIDKTDLIELRYAGRAPGEAQQVVALVCDAYMRQADDQRRAGVAAGLRFVDEQLTSARDRLKVAEDRLLAFKRRAGSVAMPEEIAAAVGELSALNNDIRTRQIALASARARQAALRGQLGMTARQALQAVAVASSPRLVALREQLMTAETAPARTMGYGPGHPERMAVEARIRELNGAIRAETRALSGRPAAAAPFDEVRMGLVRQLAEAETLAAAAAQGLTAARARHGELAAHMARLPGHEVELTRLARDVTVASELYQQLLQKREEARLELAIAPTYARVVEPAGVPTRPRNPLSGPGAPILLVAGLAAAFGTGALRDLLGRGTAPQSLFASMPQLRIFSALPTLPWAERRRGELVAERAGSPYYLEALKTLGVALEDNLPGTGGRVVALTSGHAREGKSVTLANLALCLADAGHRVLLVDGDLRRPRAHALLGLSAPGKGLAEVLLERIEPGAAVRTACGIDVVTAGETPLGSSLARLKHRLDPALAAWRADYDFVLVDLPPMVVLTEMLQFARRADGLLLLANLQQTDASVLTDSVRQLQAVKAPLLGIVAISQMVATPRGGYYLVAGETGLVS